MNDKRKGHGKVERKIKIILYGIANRMIRSKVQSYIDENCEVIGISDSIYTEDYLQGVRYIFPDNISDFTFDYIVVQAERENTQNKIVSFLQEKGINRDKIVIPRLFCVPDIDYIPDLKRDLLKEIEVNTLADGICLGLSYSLRGIDFKKFCLECIDCSWHGMDLYYCYKMAKSFVECRKKYKVALLVFPYYYFNYDMSLSEYQFNTGQILACRGFDDWHNANKSNNYVIKDYLVSMQIFGKKFWESKRWKREIPWNENVIESKQRVSQIWKNNYNETILENAYTFDLLINELADMYIVIIIPPIFMGGIEEEDKKYILQQKEVFYGVVDKYQMGNNVEIKDFSETLQLRDYYYDYEHLNEAGRQEFTKILNQVLVTRSSGRLEKKERKN